ncbi:hypothetical protein [Ruminococcus albus]|uniref:Uncharacterized protein n=1 Tax=Ruminococcus albus TaxID=1264 RepID=A0A1I1MEP8_RUMAL|nr:hypothetical protein [Ruminococcus albus]SFC83616.1 hypothetical protein SAMN02910406_02476 [Ruminococcus albus]
MGIPKRTKKLFVILILLIVLVAVLFFRFSSKIKEDQWKKAEDTAKQKTIEYVEDKYGFKADVTNIIIYHDGTVFDDQKHTTPTGTARLELEHDGKIFNVQINYEKNIGYDDYQFDDIKQALEERLNSEIPGGEAESIKVSSKGVENDPYLVELDGMVSKEAYYDGNDLSKVINNTDITMTALYTDTEFHECPLFEEIKANKDNSLFLISFKTDDIKEECDKNISIHSFEDYTAYAPYINDRWVVTDSKSEHLEPYYLRDCGDFLLYGKDLDEDAEVNVIEKDSQTMVDTFIDEMKKSYEKAGYSSPDTDYRPISKGYSFEIPTGKHGTLFAFYPKKDLKVDEDHFIMAIGSDELLMTHECGDYIVTDLWIENEFCMVETPSKFKTEQDASENSDA